MTYAWQWLCSALFVGQMYLAMPFFALIYAPAALASRTWAFRAIHAYCRWVRWTARWMIGLRSEIRGTPPEGAALIAAKHQSFFDIILIVSACRRPRFIMKRSLKWAPALGWYAMRIGCVPVDRGKRGQAIAGMVAQVLKERDDPGQLIIYPQGTRVAPGATRPYKIGTGVLYRELGRPCVPAATNVGVFWPRTGIYRKPGLAVVEFLAPVAPGLPVDDFMADLETSVEGVSNRLMQEAGFSHKG
ncbi:1-acyl-sn-glycerol-3-phosphate acyltransferase [Rhodovulum iodosum]|uniref:1-acyl-sn-glycerol-3-phosphate acyltransferase n=1 Tax=Rhodovulum iodosum TaxID=68291 RepID=A0ABV3XR88_9RHOB|nr:lysophospholipid acyltransferase family protein [Rhodovulum robiginosum]RSK32740.1 1-acyl-sn-glycerol-3-phosphate acyltransferase [Rhodovulum robiginosum]